MQEKLTGKIRSLGSKLKSRYKVSVVEDGSATRERAFNIPFWALISGPLVLFLVIFILLVILSKYTSFKEFLIGESTRADRKELLETYERIDSLEQISRANELYLSNLQKIISGTAGESIDEAIKRDSEQMARDEQNLKSQNNSKDKKYLEDEEVLKSLLELKAPILSLEDSKYDGKEREVADYSFYSPVKGIVTSGFNRETWHLATDIATKMNEPIRSILDGHVIFASFTPSTGYVTIIQHRDNLVSVYKHCEALLKKEGVFVKGGEVIALAGSTGELTTGPHLHFELWYKGNAVNPEDYINF